MKKISCKRGFTLIELLVVVLIIGILAAIAVPQYKKAVDKTRISELMQIAASLEKAADAYILQHGFPAESKSVDILPELDVEYAGFAPTGTGVYCDNRNVCIRVDCNSTSCQIETPSWQGIEPQGGPKYGLVLERRANGSTWNRTYIGCNSASPNLSTFGLETFGYTQGTC